MLTIAAKHHFTAGQWYGCRTLFTTTVLMAEPLKKKKRIDPAVLKKREEKKMKKLEREIRRLEATPKQFKPIVELQLSPNIMRELDRRQRPVTEQTTDADRQLAQLRKVWSIYRSEQTAMEFESIKAVVDSQRKALAALRRESEELFQSAISIDEELIPFENDLVKKESPPIEAYKRPDGKKSDVTKQWTM